ncbi:MAG: universal stress protein [candidate division NC10 bacterium]|nr:universal stress protein [candidate division NC10 bacterium]
MLHPPAPVPAAAAKARRSVDALKLILVPTVGAPYAEHAVELACRLGQEQKAEIALIYVVEVPRTLPLSTPLPQIEAMAQDALARGQAIVALHGLPSAARIERAREAGERILHVAQDLDADVIVLGIRPSDGGAQDLLGWTTNFLLRRAPCEVIIDKPPAAPTG